MKKPSLIYRLVHWLSPSDTTYTDNKNIILKHLYGDGIIDFSTQEVIKLFNEVKIEFEKEMWLRRLNAKMECELITEYFGDEK